MDERAVRLWGVIIGGACIAAALSVATFTGPQQKAKPAPDKAATAPAAPAAETPPAKEVKIADAGPTAAPAAAPGEPLTFIVAFAPGHPLKRAQELEAQGRHDAAVQAAHAALRGQRELRGLCYDRFTLGGAEIVLRLCTTPPESERTAVQRRWSARLSGMSGVEYAEPNVLAQPERRR
jgi:hypothetical protein